jgi:uncharacterized membrane protein
MKVAIDRRILLAAALTLAALVLCPLASFADSAQTTASAPQRSLSMEAEYPGVAVPAGQTVSMNLAFHNKGRTGESLEVWLAKVPKGWNAQIKTFKYEVSAVSVPAGEDKSLTFQAEPGQGITAGSYVFVVDARTADGRLQMTQDIVVKVLSASAGEQLGGGGIKISTSYPVLRGPLKGNYQFSLDVQNQLDADTVFDLSAQPPQGWTVNFKPAYESTFISSLSLKAGQSSTVSLQVTPPSSAAPGEYAIPVRVSSQRAATETTLKLVLTGTYELKLGTATGLLSMDARPGKEADVSIYVQNTGSATQDNVSFMSFKPENWKVAFKPDSIDTLAPGELKQVDVTITPNKEALVGDYSVSLEAKGAQQSSSNAEFRVTVKAATVWGWIGILLIVVVLGGLVAMFRFLGRR